MATTSRRRNTGVAHRLFEDPTRFEFFQAVRLLRGMRARRDPAPSGAGDELDEVARFRAHLSLDFPASEIYSLQQAAPERSAAVTPPPKMTVTFMGLTGPSGVLPRHYTEMLISRRIRQKDVTAQDFFNLFNHRLVSLFYRAWEKYRFHVRYERGDQGTVTQYLLSLVGLGTGGLQSRLQRDGVGVRDETLAYYSGLLSKRPRCAAGLQAILTDYFGAAVEVMPLWGRWLRLAQTDRTRLGARDAGGVLGEGAVLGERVWDRQSKVRIRFGPLCWSRFVALLPGGAESGAVNQLVRFFLGPSLDYELQLVLQAAEVPAFRLGNVEASAPRLGWSIWLKNQPLAADASQPVFAGMV